MQFAIGFGIVDFKHIRIEANGTTVYPLMSLNGFNSIITIKLVLGQYGLTASLDKLQQIVYESWIKFVSSMGIVYNATLHQI